MIQQSTRCTKPAPQAWQLLRRNFRQAVAALVLGVGGLAPSAWAQPANITPGERSLMPAYCADTQSFAGYGDASYNTSPRAGHWISMMGKTFWHMHHYCWALVDMHRARFAATPQERNGTLKRAIADLVYVVNNGTADFVLLPEVFLKIGDSYSMMGDIGKAMDAYAAARTKKPDYWPAYANWAKTLADAGLKARALTALEDGLRVMPGEPNLLKAHAKLGGNADAAARRRPAEKAPAPATTPATATATATATAPAPAAVKEEAQPPR